MNSPACGRNSSPPPGIRWRRKRPSFWRAPQRLAGLKPTMITRPSGTSTRSTSRSARCGSRASSSACGSTTRSRLAASNGKASKWQRRLGRRDDGTLARCADRRIAAPHQPAPARQPRPARRRRPTRRPATGAACDWHAARRVAASRAAKREIRTDPRPHGRGGAAPTRAGTDLRETAATGATV